MPHHDALCQLSWRDGFNYIFTPGWLSPDNLCSALDSITSSSAACCLASLMRGKIVASRRCSDHKEEDEERLPRCSSSMPIFHPFKLLDAFREGWKRPLHWDLVTLLENINCSLLKGILEGQIEYSSNYWSCQRHSLVLLTMTQKMFRCHHRFAVTTNTVGCSCWQDTEHSEGY